MPYLKQDQPVRTLYDIPATEYKPALPRGSVGVVATPGWGAVKVEFAVYDYYVYTKDLEALCGIDGCEVAVSKPGAMCPECESFYTQEARHA